jgi:peptidoglycan hydrolase-like amidase
MHMIVQPLFTLKRWMAGFLALAVFAGFLMPAAGGAQARTYFADVKSGAGALVMEPGEVRSVELAFVNRSDFEWSNDGEGYISLYTHGPKYRRSVFDPGTWLWWNQVARIREVSVAPGQVASMKVDLKAPAAEGQYTESFWLASEGRAWIEGGRVDLVIDVKSGAGEAEVVVEEEVEVAAPVASEEVHAELVLVSAQKVTLASGRSTALKAVVKNAGDGAWNQVGLVSDSSLFSAADWNGGVVASVNEAVGAGASATVPFTIKAPAYNGTHEVTLEIVANGTRTGETVELTVEVTGAEASIDDLDVDDYAVQVDLTPTVTLIDEPIIRIGLFTVDEETDYQVIVTSTEGAYSLTTASGTVLASLTTGQEVTAYYANNRYYYNAAGAGLKESTEALRFVPASESQVMKITNFDRRVTRSAGFADNTFRGTLEIRHNTHKNRVWMINELPMEYYLRGLAETSNSSPMEYQKTMVIAARSFAYFYMQNPNSARTNEGFHLVSYSADQVYNGYEKEARMPLFVDAVTATKGTVVYYDGKVAITPYFAQSNGATKDWSSVWWGNRAYAKGVKVPCDVGKAQRGHGVGISATGAICMANEGKTSTEILNHFFTGIEIKRTW